MSATVSIVTDIVDPRLRGDGSKSTYSITDSSQTLVSHHVPCYTTGALEHLAGLWRSW